MQEKPMATDPDLLLRLPMSTGLTVPIVEHPRCPVAGVRIVDDGGWRAQAAHRRCRAA